MESIPAQHYTVFYIHPHCSHCRHYVWYFIRSRIYCVYRSRIYKECKTWKWFKCISMHQVRAKRAGLQLAEQWQRGLRRAVPGIQYMFGVRAFLPPNLHQIVPQNPGQIEYIWSPSVCFKNAHHAPLLFSDRTIESSIGRFQAHDLQVSRKLLIRISVLLRNIPPFWKGGQQWQVRRQQNSRNVELIKFLPSSNTRPRYLIYEYRWRVSGCICQNTHLTLRR